MDDDSKKHFGSDSNPFEDLKRQFNDIFGPSSGKFNLMPMLIEGKPATQGQETNEEEEQIHNFIQKYAPSA
jgi:hypothetical protein